MSDKEDYEVIAQAVTALRYHDETQLADHLATVETERMEQARSRMHTLKRVVTYLTLTVVIGTGLAGGVLAAFRGDLVTTAGFSVYLFGMIVLIGVLNSALGGLRDWFAEATDDTTDTFDPSDGGGR